MKRWLIIFLGIFVVVAVVVLVAGNVIARKAVESGVEGATGFPLQVGGLKVQLFSSRIEATQVQLLNPPDFEERLFVDLPRLVVDYRLGSFFSSKPHVNELTLDVDRLVIVVNKQKESNVSRLKGVADAAAEKPGTPKPGEETAQQQYQVDVLNIKVGSVIYKDYSKSEVKDRTLTLNLNQTFKNITEGTDISRLVLLAVLREAGLPDVGVSIDALKKGLGSVTDSAGEAVNTATEAIKEAGKEIEKAGKGLLEGAKDLIPKTK